MQAWAGMRAKSESCKSIWPFFLNRLASFHSRSIGLLVLRAVEHLCTWFVCQSLPFSLQVQIQVLKFLPAFWPLMLWITSQFLPLSSCCAAKGLLAGEGLVADFKLWTLSELPLDAQLCFALYLYQRSLRRKGNVDANSQSQSLHLWTVTPANPTPSRGTSSKESLSTRQASTINWRY